MFPTFGSLHNSSYSVERLSGEDATGQKEVQATNLIDAVNLLIINVALDPNEIVWLQTETRELNAVERLRFEHYALVAGSQCAYNELGAKANMLADERPHRLVEI